MTKKKVTKKKTAAKPRTPITKAEEEYMLNHQGEDMNEIAKDLGRSYEFVRKFMKTIPEPKPTPKSEEGTRKIVGGHGLVTETSRGRKGVAVMTEGASQRADELRKGRKKVLGPSDAVRKIKEDG